MMAAPNSTQTQAITSHHRLPTTAEEALQIWLKHRARRMLGVAKPPTKPPTVMQR